MGRLDEPASNQSRFRALLHPDARTAGVNRSAAVRGGRAFDRTRPRPGIRLPRLTAAKQSLVGAAVPGLARRQPLHELQRRYQTPAVRAVRHERAVRAWRPAAGARLEGLGGTGRPAVKRFGVEDPVIARLVFALVLDVPDSGIEDLILGHFRVRAEVDRVVSTATRFFLSEGQECSTDALALLARQRGDSIDVKAKLSLVLDYRTNDPRLFLSNPNVLGLDLG